MKTLLEKLQAAGLPIERATEQGEISGIAGVVMTKEQEILLEDICREHLNPSKHADLLLARADKHELRNQYQTAITRLQQIETAVSPTNAQVIQAIKDLAKYQRLLLKLLARMI